MHVKQLQNTAEVEHWEKFLNNLDTILQKKPILFKMEETLECSLVNIFGCSLHICTNFSFITVIFSTANSKWLAIIYYN